MVGGLLLGMSEILFVAFLPALSGYRDAFIFLILIFILLFKPDGICSLYYFMVISQEIFRAYGLFLLRAVIFTI